MYDHVGAATLFISCHNEQTSVKVLIDTLVDFCEEKGFDPKRTHIWVACFCVNETRHSEWHDFETLMAYMKMLFGGCGDAIFVLSSWKDPDYLERIWIISELFAAVVQGCNITFTLPPSERVKLVNEISNTGYSGVVRSLPPFDVDNGEASNTEDRENLIKYIKSEYKPGIQDFNAKVNAFMKAYVTHEYTKQCQIVQRHRTGGNSDNPRNAVDRLDYDTYAEAIVSVARKIEDTNSNLCVALMASWGVGKTMLWLRIRARLLKCDEDECVKFRRNRAAKFGEESSIANRAAFLALRDVSKHINSSMLSCTCSNAQRYETICLLLVLPLLIVILSIAIYFSFMSKSVSAWLLFPFFILGTIEVILFLALLIINYRKLSMNYEYDGNKDSFELTIQVLRILKGERGLTYQFSSNEQLSLLACVRIVVLLCIQVLVRIGNGLVHLLLFTISHLGPIMLGTSTQTSPPVDRSGDTQAVLPTTHIFVEFNAWEYNGSKNLWASIMDKLWEEVEKQYSPTSVRLHRASVTLSKSKILPADSFEIREQKRQKALIRYYIRWCLSVGVFLFSVVCFVVYYPWKGNEDTDRNQSSSSQAPSQAPFQEETSAENVSDLVMKVLTTLGLSGGTVQFAVMSTSFCINILPKLRSNPFGALVKETKKMGAEHQRYDFSAHFGFMGRVRQEVGHLYDFLKNNHIRDDYGVERSARLCIFVDDLDRCEAQEIVDVLRAVQLLLEDPNEENEIVTTWLAIDSRIIVSSINQIYKGVLDDAQLDGNCYLEKMVNVPFSIPEMTNEKKTSYLDNLFLSGNIALSRLLGYILSQQGSDIVHAAYDQLSNNQKKLYPDLGFLLEKRPFSGIEMKSSIEKHCRSLVNGFFSVHMHPKTSPNIKMILSVEVAKNSDDVNFTSENIKSLQRATEEYLQAINRQVFDAVAQSRKAAVPTPEFEVKSENSPEFTNEDGNLEQRHQALSDVGDNQVSEVEDIENPSDYESIVRENSPRMKTEKENSASMMTPDERRWISKFISFCPGRARSITRVINIYNISRSIAFSKNMHLMHEADAFQRKLMKSILLAEFWPMLLACTIHAIEDCLQEEDIICTPREEKSWDHDGMPRTANKMNNLIKSIFKVQTREDILALPLSRVYQHLIMPLLSIVETDSVTMTDGDPQLFQHLLQEQDPLLKDGLKVSDLISADQMVSLSVQSVRPYIFNLQSYMLERIARSINSVILHVREENGSVEIAYENKSDYFAKYRGRHQFGNWGPSAVER